MNRTLMFGAASGAMAVMLALPAHASSPIYLSCTGERKTDTTIDGYTDSQTRPVRFAALVEEQPSTSIRLSGDVAANLATGSDLTGRPFVVETVDLSTPAEWVLSNITRLATPGSMVTTTSIKINRVTAAVTVEQTIRTRAEDGRHVSAELRTDGTCKAQPRQF